MTERSSGIEKRGIGKKTRIFLAGLATLGAIETAGAITTELTNNQPISIVRTIPDDLRWPITLVENLMNQKVPETFANKAGKTKFGENNVTKITPEEARDKRLVEPKIEIDNNGAVIYTTLMPGIFPNTIPDTETTYEARAKENEAPVAETDIPISKGYQLTIPKGVHYALMRPNKAETYRDPNLVYTILTYYYDPINDITIRLTYESTGFVPSDGQKTYSWDGGEYNKLYNPAFGGNFENLPISDGESPLTKPASGNETLRMFAVAASGKIKPFTNLPEALAQYRKIQWEKIVDQNQKLILISSK